MLEAALKYAALGWPIFPLAQGTKNQPLTRNGVLDASCDAGQIRRWWGTWPEANIGLDCGGAGLMVLDFDPGADMNATLQAVEAPKTGRIASTPRGGFHFFYTIAGDEKVAPSASKIAPHVDVRSYHSYVVLAPSYIEGVGKYAWEDEGWPSYRSDEMIRRASAAKEKHSDRDQWVIEPDMPTNVELATEWLKNEASPSVEGMGGDNAAYGAAAMLRSFGVSEATSLDLLLEFYNPRCQPPWGGEVAGDYFAEKISHAHQYATNPPGNMTPAYHSAMAASMFKPVKPKPLLEVRPGEFKREGFRFTTYLGIDAITAPPWLLPGYLPQGAYALLCGPHGSYKSFLALDMALTVAYGYGGWDIGDAGPVLFAAGEGRAGLKARVQAWREHFGAVGDAPFVLVDPLPRAGNPATTEQLIQGALSLYPGGYKLVVLDTVGRSMAGLNENQQEGASLFTALAERIGRELGVGGMPATVLGLHHVNKSGLMRGSSVFGADADTILAVEAKDGECELSVAKQKDAEEAVPIIFDMSPVGASLVPVRTDKTRSQKTAAAASLEASKEIAEKWSVNLASEMVLRILRNYPGRGFSTSALSQEMALDHLAAGRAAETFRAYLKKMAQMPTCGAFRHYDPERKQWCLTTDPIPGDDETKEGQA
jgi:hypothetical protein